MHISPHLSYLYDDVEMLAASFFRNSRVAASDLDPFAYGISQVM